LPQKRLLAPGTALDKVTPCLVSPKTNYPSPAQRSVRAGAQKAISELERNL